MQGDVMLAPLLELKFADGGALGEFSGYGAVFNNVDSHGDVIKPGAFAESLAERKAQGRPNVPMHVMHGIFGGDGLPVGVWKNIEEDDTGLRVDGKISGMNTDSGRLMYERVRDGALAGMSIGYKEKPGGAILGKKDSSEPKRTLTKLDLRELSLVDDPSNPLTRVTEMKSLMGLAEKDKAAAAIVSAMHLHNLSMSGHDSPTTEERTQLLAHLQDAHEALTGYRMPPSVKSAPTTIREFEQSIREMLGLSRSQARAIAEHGFKSLADLRDEEGGAPAISPEVKATLSSISAGLKAFTLSKT